MASNLTRMTKSISSEAQTNMDGNAVKKILIAFDYWFKSRLE